MFRARDRSTRPGYPHSMNGNEFADSDAENVVVTSGDVTTINNASEPDVSGDPVAAGGEAIAASLSPDGEVLNVAFMTGGGHAQIIQVKVEDLIRGREAARAGDAAVDGGAGTAARDANTQTRDAGAGSDAGDDNVTVITGDLATVSAAAIAANAGAATSLVGIPVAAALGADGALSLTFVDGNGDLQLVETNVAELVP